MRKCVLALVCASSFLVSVPSHAAYTIKDGKLMATDEIATLSVEEHYSLTISAHEKKQWQELTHQSTILLKNFPESPFAREAGFYLAVGFFHLNELELANKSFSKYLRSHSAPKFFEETMRYKFEIAELYQKGEKKHLFGVEIMPKWIPAGDEALEIYDEIINAMPHHELAIHSLYGKGLILLNDNDFKSSVDVFQSLIRKFGKHPLACESFIGIGKVYLSQCKKEYADPDFLDLAELNFKKFLIEFPSEPRIALAEEMLSEMREIYAGTLYNTAQFYERTKKPHASAIYYNKIVSKYPQTRTALDSGDRLVFLEKKYKKPFKDLKLFQEISEDIALSEEQTKKNSKELVNELAPNPESLPLDIPNVNENKSLEK